MVTESRRIQPTDMAENPRFFFNLVLMKYSYLINIVCLNQNQFLLTGFISVLSEVIPFIEIKLSSCAQSDKIIDLRNSCKGLSPTALTTQYNQLLITLLDIILSSLLL
jgi:hypothetical protein